MAGSLERDVEYAEYLVECSKQHPKALLNSAANIGTIKGKSIHQKLLELYIEECEKQPEHKELCYASHILPKLMKREKLNCLILNLYPANEGYSLVLKARNGMESETIKLPYEESDLLEYIDAAQLPPFLVDLLEKTQVNFFYSGCVIVEIRDFRRSTSAIHDHDSQYILLKPTPQSLLCDINAITNDGHRWTQDDIFQLESRLLLETEEPLCLDPSPAVQFISNRLQFDQKQLNNPILKRSVRKYSQAAINKKRKLAQAPAPKELKLFDFLHRKRDRNRGTVPVNLKVAKSNVDMWKQRIVQLQPPESIDVEKFAKVIEKPSSSAHQPLVLIEEHTLERDPSQDHKIMARITIRQNPVTNMFLGELYLDHNFSTEKQSDGNVCKFTLGSKENVDKYFEQFKELFTEEGRKSVKITTQKPNQPPCVTYTQTIQSVNTSGATTIQITNAQALLKQQTSVAATITTQNEAPLTAGLSAKRNVPIQLSLSIGPPGGVTIASNLITSQSVTTLASPASTVQSGQILVPQQSGLLAGNAQRLKSFPVHASQIRSTSSPSPASTPTTVAVQQQIFSVTASQPSNQKTPTPGATPTPPPSHSRTPTPTSMGNRRTSGTDRRTSGTETVTFSQGEAVQQQKNNPSTTITQQGNITTSINIANIGSLPQNFNLQGLGLQGVNITNLQGLQNMQVSLTGVSMPGGGIAVPVPITLINTNPSILQNQGIIVSSMPNVISAVSSSESASSSGAVSGNKGNEAAVTSHHTYVTMVTLPASTSITSSTTTNTTVSSHAIMSTGLASNQTTVLPAQSNVLQLPIGMAGNITQLMPMGTKTQSRQSNQSLPVLQLQGQPGIQLVNLQQQRGQIKTGIPTSSNQQGGNRPLTSTATVPISTVLTQVSQPLTSHQITALPVTSLTVGKPGQTGQGQILMQLAGQQGIQPQQLQTALTFQKPQQTHQPLQFHQLQLKPSAPTQSTSHTSKSKTKKRTTPTPPRT